MIRGTIAVIAGYVSMALFIMITFSLTWMVVGYQFAFKAGTTDVTPGWIAITLPLDLLAAVLGGWIAVKIARGEVAPRVLAGIVLVLGLTLAFISLRLVHPVPPKPIPQISTFEAASYAVEPDWYQFAVPFIGAIGVLIGSRLGRRRSKVEAQPAGA
ncbi:MAG: hypothetical protein WBX15_13900 [Thermoanaerobaculia bacterium]